MPDRGDDALNWVGGSQVVPVLRGEVEERQQGSAAPGHARCSLLILYAVLFDEDIHRGPGLGAGLTGNCGGGRPVTRRMSLQISHSSVGLAFDAEQYGWRETSSGGGPRTVLLPCRSII